MRLPLLSRLRGRPRSRGQSLVEFALLLPVMLLVLMVALDFGRVYLGYINLHNMVRIAANFAANNPTAPWGSNTHPDVVDYRAQIMNDAKATNCILTEADIPAPTYTDQNGSGTTDIGDLASVGITCKFRIVTPIISGIVGTNGEISVSAEAAFPVKSGMAQTGGGGGGVAPVANFQGTPTVGEEPLVVQFTDTSTGNPTEWQWDFDGDGVVDSSLQNPVFAFGFGTHTVTLTVNNGSSSDSETKVAYIGVTTSTADVNFAATPVSGTSPLTVAFLDTSAAPATAWEWDFDGDGNVDDTVQSPSHTYTLPGSYSVTLTITTDTGQLTKTIDDMITVSSPLCVVPVFVGTSTSSAQGTWAAAKFTTTVQFKQGGLPWLIESQNITGNSSVSCDSTIRVSSNSNP